MPMATTNTKNPRELLDAALSSVPAELRQRLIKSYADLKMRALEGQHDAVGVRAGRLAEVLLRVLQHLLLGSYTPLSAQVNNFKGECERLEKVPATAGQEGIRILMPRALCFLYSLRNKRDFGHVGGEVNANSIDSSTATKLGDWCMSELVRICHAIPIEDAQTLCDAIAERVIPQLWSVMGRKRVLDTSLSYVDQTLFLLYSELETGVPVEDLFEWTEHSNMSNFRRDVVKRLHNLRQIEWDRDTDIAILSPTGVQRVEAEILSRLAT